MKFSLLIATSMILSACLATPNSFQSDNLSYTPISTEGDQHVAILQKYCSDCHSSGTASAGYKFIGWTNQQFVDRGLLTAGDPNNSVIYTYLLGIGDTMPPAGNPQPTSAQIQNIKDWVTSVGQTTP